MSIWRHTKGWRVATAILALAAAPAVCAATVGAATVLERGAGARWKVLDLGTPLGQPRAFMSAVAINERGAVLVSSLATSGRSQAYLWQRGKFTRLSFPGAASVDVYALNDLGDVVGDAGPSHAVVWWDGKATDLGSLGGGGTAPVAVNNSDEVVGDSLTRDKHRHAFIWRNGEITDLGTLGGDESNATGINRGGQVIGTSQLADGSTHAFTWKAVQMTDLGSVSGLDSRAIAINDNGVIVGAATTRVGVDVDALVWRHQKLSNLGKFGRAGAAAYAVNARGEILVATVQTTGDPSGALLLSQGRRVKVSGLGGAAPANQGGSLIVTALNNRGQVAGYGYLESGARRSFVWQNGKAVVLPTFDGVDPPWGAATRLNNHGVLTGTTYVSHNGENFQHAAIWERLSG